MQDLRYKLDRKNSIVTLEIDTAGPVNTVGARFVDDLEQAARKANQDRARGMIIQSGKEKSFLDGANLVEIFQNPSPRKLEHLVLTYQETLHALATSPFPVVAVLVEQTALGGGFELLLWACDRVFATPGVKMGLPEVNVGLFPAAGGMETLKRVVGFETALELVMAGKVLPAAFYEAAGLVEIVGPARIRFEALSWIDRNPAVTNRNYDPARQPVDELSPEQCREILRKARARYTVCPQRPYFEAALTAIEEGLTRPFRKAAAAQVRHFAPLIEDPHVKNKIDAFFAVTTVAPKLVGIDVNEATHLDAVAILGAGLMGRGIAQVCADKGLKVLLFDVNEATARKAKLDMAEDLKPLVRKSRWTGERLQKVLDNVQPTADEALLKTVSLVIESVFEDLELKQSVLRKVQGINPEAVFATNTSALPLADIASGSMRPDQVVGMHYFSPVPVMPLLEIVRGPNTSESAIATALTCGRRQKKTCIVVSDGPGFYTSRTFGAYVITGFYLAELGLDPWDVDRLALAAGFPQGPLHVYGTAGGNVIYHAASFLQTRRPEIFALPQTLIQMFQAGYVGAGKPCFYKKGLEPDESARQFVATLPSLPRPAEDEAREMLLLAMVNQAFLCLDDGVLSDYFTMDIGAVLGIGFPDCWHGPARYVSLNGVKRTGERLRSLYETYGLAHFKPAEEFAQLAAFGVDRGLI